MSEPTHADWWVWWWRCSSLGKGVVNVHWKCIGQKDVLWGRLWFISALISIFYISIATSVILDKCDIKMQLLYLQKQFCYVDIHSQPIMILNLWLIVNQAFPNLKKKKRKKKKTIALFECRHMKIHTWRCRYRTGQSRCKSSSRRASTLRETQSLYWPL